MIKFILMSLHGWSNGLYDLLNVKLPNSSARTGFGLKKYNFFLGEIVTNL